MTLPLPTNPSAPEVNSSPLLSNCRRRLTLRRVNPLPPGYVDTKSSPCCVKADHRAPPPQQLSGDSAGGGARVGGARGRRGGGGRGGAGGGQAGGRDAGTGSPVSRR
eukprot:1185716-Prorocentrum_minimum.AAC.1